MTYTHTRIYAALLFGLAIAVFVPIHIEVQAAYYPTASPNTNYVLPGQNLTFSGRGFAPNEVVTLRNNQGPIISWRVNEFGSFRSQGNYAVPYFLSESEQTYTLMGNVSDRRVPIEVVVGTYYPNLNPSSYFVSRGSRSQAFGEDFAPFEPVELYIRGAYAGRDIADENGAVNWSYITPRSGSSFGISARGIWSGTESSRTITLQ